MLSYYLVRWWSLNHYGCLLVVAESVRGAREHAMDTIEMYDPVGLWVEAAWSLN